MYSAKPIPVNEYYEISKYYYTHIGHSRPLWHRRIWNKSTKEVLGRNGMSWAKTLLFFLLFYTLLMIFFIICWSIFYATVSLNTPRSLLSQPGLLFEPICEILQKYPYIEYCETYNAEIQCYSKRIEEFLDKYGKQRNFGECTKASSYGYANHTPCIFLKLNRSIGFKLDAIESADDLPVAAPQQLRNYLKTSTPSAVTNRLWVSCETLKNERITINYFPSQGILASALHMEEKRTYDRKFYNNYDFERIIAVQLTNIPLNKRIKLKCLAWAKNIKQDNSAFIGPGHGYVQIDIKIES